MSNTPITESLEVILTPEAQYHIGETWKTAVSGSTARMFENMCDQMEKELFEIVDWMRVEKAPLREQEIASIERLRARWQFMKAAK